MRWVNKMAFLQNHQVSFPVARKNGNFGFEYAQFPSVQSFLLEVTTKPDERRYFEEHGCLLTTYHLFSMDHQLCRYIVDLDIKQESLDYEHILQSICFEIIAIFNSMFPTKHATMKNVWVTDSCGPTIGSYHISLRGYSFFGVAVQKYMFDNLVKALPQYAKFLDNTQTLHHLLRAVGCAKDGRMNLLRHSGRPSVATLFGSQTLYCAKGCDTYETMLNLLAAELTATSTVADTHDMFMTTPNSTIMKRKVDVMECNVIKPLPEGIEKTLLAYFPHLCQYNLKQKIGNKFDYRRREDLIRKEIRCVQCEKTHSSDNAFVKETKNTYAFYCWSGVRNKLAPIIVKK